MLGIEHWKKLNNPILKCIASIATWHQHPFFPIIGSIVAFFLYIGIAWFILQPEALWSPDEGAKLLQLINIRIVDGIFYSNIIYTGQEIDHALHFAIASQNDGILRIVDNHLVLQRLPIFPLLTLPIYSWLGLSGLYIIPALSGAVITGLTLLLIRPCNRRFMMWITIAFASPILIYSTLFWEHTLATTIAFAGMLLVFWKGSRREMNLPLSIGVWIISAILFGTAIFLRLEFIIFILAFLASFLLVMKRNWREILFISLMLAIVLILFPIIHKIIFNGEILPSNAFYLFRYPLAYIKNAQWKSIPDLLIGPNVEGAITYGWIGVLWSATSIIVVVLSFYSEKSRVAWIFRLIGLGISIIIATYYLFTPAYYRSAHGLLFTTPWVIVGLYRSAEIWKENEWRPRIIVLTIALGLLGYALGILALRASSPHGGLEWGARFAMPFFPLLALITAWNWKRKRRIEIVAIIILIGLGIGFQARGINIIQRDKNIGHAINQTLLESQQENVLTDLWWLPHITAPIYPQKSVFVATTPVQLAKWIKMATDNHYYEFILVTEDTNLVQTISTYLENEHISITDEKSVDLVKFYRVLIELK